MVHSEFSWESKARRNIYAQEWRPEGKAKAVVALVHGLGEHSGRYQHVAAALTQAGYALVGFDLPGHGRSDGARGYTSFEEIGDEIDCLLSLVAQRYGRSPYFLYGHSLGGALVLYHVLTRRPTIQGAIVTSPGLAAGGPVPGWKRLVARMMVRLAPAFTLPSGLDRQNLSRDPAVIQAYSQDPYVHDRVSARLGWDILTKGDTILSLAKTFPVPLLLVQGGSDHIVSLEKTRAFAGAAPAGLIEYKEWEGFYHETHNEPEKEQVLQYLVGWLDRQCSLIPQP